MTAWTDAAGEVLALAERRGALVYGDFTLTSGRASRYYFDGRVLTLDPAGARLVAGAFLPELVRMGAEVVGAPATAGIPLVAAIAALSGQGGRGIPGFFVRAEAKGHGLQREVEGVVWPGASAVVLDDVCTTAGSLIRVIEAAEGLGCTVLGAMAILDRGEGGSDELRRRGHAFASLLEATPSGEVVVSE